MLFLLLQEMSAVLDDKRIVLVLLKTFSNQLMVLDVPQDIIIVLQRQMITAYLKKKGKQGSDQVNNDRNNRCCQKDH